MPQKHGRELPGLGAERRPTTRAVGAAGKTAEARGRLERELAPERGVVAAELPLSERMREYHRGGALCRGAVLGCREPTPACRLYPERLQRPVHDEQRPHAP